MSNASLSLRNAPYRAVSFVFAALIAFCLFAAPAAAQTVITTNTVISDGNTTFDNQDIIVRSNATVTIDGPHTFKSLVVEYGTLTHTPSGSAGIS